MKHLILPLAIAAFMSACGNAQKTPSAAVEQQITISFDADSAYEYVARQVAFGSRTPQSEAHAQCLEYMITSLRRFGAEVELHEGQMRYFDGSPAPVRNVIAHLMPEKANRIILCAHWDSRMWADHDADPDRRREPVMGANDGASGVGVLLEVARQLQKQNPKIGVDIILFDNEDNGTPAHVRASDVIVEDSWCLGSQLWAQDVAPHQPARYGILLDMVGAPNAMFFKEMYSQLTAKHVVDKVWRAAEGLGYANYFVNDNGAYVTDDHYYMNEIANIPVCDIIQYDPQSATSFGSYWHTVNDVMDNVDRKTLEAVGRTVLQVVYSEK